MTVIQLTNDASSRLTGIPLALYSERYDQLCDSTLKAWDKYIRWGRLARGDSRKWQLYERKEADALDRWRVAEEARLAFEREVTA